MIARFYAGAKDSLSARHLQCELREKLLAYARELENERYFPHTRLALSQRAAAAE